jgi:hypothetical protein
MASVSIEEYWIMRRVSMGIKRKGELGGVNISVYCQILGL